MEDSSSEDKENEKGNQVSRSTSCSYCFDSPCHSSGCWSLALRHGGLGSSAGQVLWDLWFTRWLWGWFSLSASVSPAIHSDCIT
jgi:hypothetical protein